MRHLVWIFLASCVGTQPLGTAMPSREICNLGAFVQELTVAPSFQVARAGDHAYSDDATVRRALAADATAVAKQGACPGSKPLGTFRMRVDRIEVGATRGRATKGLMFGLIPLTLGFSTIYPFSEERWLTIELAAEAIVDGKRVWNGEFTSHTRVRTMAKELPSSGSVLTELMKKAQSTAASELLAASRAK